MLTTKCNGCKTSAITNISASQMSRAESESEMALESSSNNVDEREGKFLNYWLTRTITNTEYSYTITSKMASIHCTPRGFIYSRCPGY